ncbi:RNA polymerase sigma factor (sigma-70 family) [Murinocardiopsis flavida]|uniref:RNA polymerase sigma factor (Sigma-70 family) n=1 Tax=Murinocardiopsis flavida TaxID=645275 RepID=A0A2P8CXK4_9ACTN|nr:sigma-70 family RNA polymerase sigma factor [Murinocardiopsis flavida]PSK89667.1 RNA polymerase sigma factor (sigma-70 family) [Murinocardiopsis flavida]
MAASADPAADGERPRAGGDAPAADPAARIRARAVRAAAPELPDDRDALKAALARLPRHERRAVVLRFLGGRSPDQIAAAMRVPPEQVRLLLTRSLDRLRTDLLS